MEGTGSLEPEFPLLKSKVKARKISSRTQLLLSELGDVLFFFLLILFLLQSQLKSHITPPKCLIWISMTDPNIVTQKKRKVPPCNANSELCRCA